MNSLMVVVAPYDAILAFTTMIQFIIAWFFLIFKVVAIFNICKTK